MSCPMKLVVDDHSFNAEGFDLGQNADVGASVIPLDSENLAEAPLMLSFKNLEVSTVYDPDFSTVQESRDNCLVHKKLVFSRMRPQATLDVDIAQGIIDTNAFLVTIANKSGVELFAFLQKDFGNSCEGTDKKHDVVYASLCFCSLPEFFSNCMIEVRCNPEPYCAGRARGRISSHLTSESSPREVTEGVKRGAPCRAVRQGVSPPQRSDAPSLKLWRAALKQDQPGALELASVTNPPSPPLTTTLASVRGGRFSFEPTWLLGKKNHPGKQERGNGPCLCSPAATRSHCPWGTARSGPVPGSPPALFELSAARLSPGRCSRIHFSAARHEPGYEATLSDTTLLVVQGSNGTRLAPWDLCKVCSCYAGTSITKKGHPFFQISFE
ncbi:uncharacterized protein LOC120407378 [Mauremys reevesii]|uniref:uncharacterized protein LOC120407378 n=1 Tax=Mauremys reevesii TaxID=260615 RepID=UPI00193F9754|nr:uncharacterized protein LOC120407378 [Mauremys reevesii]